MDRKKGPFRIWEKESVAEREEMNALVAEERELEEERAQQQREDARTPGTDCILLYPWLMQLRRENPEREFWLVEDNAPSHGRAASLGLLSAELTEERIFRCNWPPNSPDLNTIEAVWDDFKVLVNQPQTLLVVPATNFWQNNVDNRGPYKGKVR